MKKGLIKKSLICCLSLSFSLFLASCTNASSGEKTSSTTNIFKDSDVLAYAKKYRTQKEKGKLCYNEVDLTTYNVATNTKNYGIEEDTLLTHYNLYLNKYRAYMQFILEYGDSISYVNTHATMGDYYGYIAIHFTSGDIQVVTFDGKVLVSKQQASNFDVQRIAGSDYSKDGKYTFYDILSYNDGTTDVTKIYQIEGTFADGKMTPDYTRTELNSSSGIDYSVLDDRNNYMPLKNYDLYFLDNSVAVKDIKGNLKSTFNLDLSNDFIALDDKLIYQTTEAVTINDNYTYSNNGMKIKQDQTGLLYCDAMDIPSKNYTYTETDIPIDEKLSNNAEEILNIIMGGNII